MSTPLIGRATALALLSALAEARPAGSGGSAYG